MTIEELYSEIGGSYETVMNQLRKETLVARFIVKFLDDQTFNNLTKYIEEKNYDEAFRESHTLKGVSLNLAFKKLSEVAIILTDELRENNKANRNDGVIYRMYTDVKFEYDKVCNLIKEYQASL